MEHIRSLIQTEEEAAAEIRHHVEMLRQSDADNIEEIFGSLISLHERLVTFARRTRSPGAVALAARLWRVIEIQHERLTLG